MLSGGEEGVLVMWQYKTGRQEFLPRLNSPINHLAISPDDSLTAVSHRENGMSLNKVAVGRRFISDQNVFNFDGTTCM